MKKRNPVRAIEAFRLAEEAGADPDVCSAGRWTCYMYLHEYAAAWRESDSIELRGRPDPHRFWSGEPLEGRHVMLRCLHGLGDSLQFLRFAPHLRKKAQSLTLEVQPALKPLFEDATSQQSGFGGSHHNVGVIPNRFWDMQVEVNELPRLFRVSTTDLLHDWPYLRLSDGLEQRLPRRDQRRRIGLIWAAGDYDKNRSIPADLLDPLLETPEIDWYSLQAGVCHEDAKRWTGKIGKLCRESTPILDVARWTQELDLTITVDTMNAHLAGSMNCFGLDASAVL